ncbi:hypothetical protein Cgig2_020065 [Carnegiea gigantea]|uniref:Chloride channel protein n=1 Tax=Carnegiea gigantea TaxID=171969 RepID=A0A9Q1KEA4_9CARY|nr:hypothetical protein Cgig2_020065 [Carnegiea gigantea]
MERPPSPVGHSCFSLHRNSAFYRWPPPFSVISLSTAKISLLSTPRSKLISGCCSAFSVRRLSYGLHRRRNKNSYPIKAPAALPESRDSELMENESDRGGAIGLLSALEDIPEANSAIISACLVGLLTGFGVVLFNYVVHELRDISWDGVVDRGASWLREEPLKKTWQRTIFVPACGGLIVSMLNVLRDAFDVPGQGEVVRRIKGVLQPFLKTVAACITLGTGNSLGPEGPSVEIGSSIGKGVGTLFGATKRKVPLIAAGSAAGLASGFNATVAGCFFAVESVLWPSADSAVSLTSTTSMVIISAVIASVISEVGLGAEPAFKVPVYDFRSASELPLYLLLGILCGLVSLSLTRCTTIMLRGVEEIQRTGRIPKAVFPVTGGLAVGLAALAYPEILYWGFQNVDILLESRPFVKGLSADLLIQIVGVKILATSFCRASGLVGGYYAPSLFIGAGTGMAYGKLIAFAVSQSHPIFPAPWFEVASPQAYALVNIILLFPCVSSNFGSVSSGYSYLKVASSADDICELESSRCFDDSDTETEELQRKILVSQAMRTRFATVFRSTLVDEAVSLMLAVKQSYALIVDDNNLLSGILSLEDIQGFLKSAKARRRIPEELLVAEVCSFDGEKCKVRWTATPGMDLLSAEMIIVRNGLSQLPVVSEHARGHLGRPVGVIDMQCITLACRAVATKQYLNQNFMTTNGTPE